MDGRSLKLQNALISGSFLLPAILFVKFQHPTILTWFLSFVFGVVWANWFEYAYHRWADHTPGSHFEKEHRKHHRNPEEIEHINLGENPLITAGMFIVNWCPMMALDLYLHWGFSGPLLISFVAYVLFMEEAHWRIHTGEWLPFNMGRVYHLDHHTRPRGKFNIFLPIFDWVFGTL